VNSFSDIEQQWQQTLNVLYPEREINNLFRFAVEDLFGLSTGEQLIQKEKSQPEGIVSKLAEVRDRLLTGEPLQYITGFTYFDELKITVSPAVLIPRPETEELVHWVLESLPKAFDGSITDWCTGSGCIALALSYHLKQAAVSGFDLSDEALELAKLNAKNLGLEVSFQLKDALAADPNDSRTDIIVSNPPYIPAKELAEMRTNVKGFEPHMALFVPDNEALLFYEAITLKAIEQLNQGGMLFFELHENFAEQTKAMVEATQAFEAVEIRKDLQDKPRMLKAIRKSGVI